MHDRAAPSIKFPGIQTGQTPSNVPPHFTTGPASHVPHALQRGALYVSEYWPLSQLPHTRLDVGVTSCATYLPGLHCAALVNGCASDSTQKCWSGHASQVEVDGLPNCPGKHAPSHVERSVVLNCPHGHAAHGSRFCPDLNIPAGHCVQVPLGDPTAERPVMHSGVLLSTQCDMSVLPDATVNARPSPAALEHSLHCACASSSWN